MTNPIDKIRDHYSKSLSEHGVSPMAVGWRDTASQTLRFSKLMTVADGLSGPIEINELGVGYGALHDYIAAHGPAIRLFRGYDIVPGMLDAARARLPSKGVELKLGARLDAMADVSVTSGIFNVRGLPDEAEWHDYIIACLDNMHEQSRYGFAFNLLSSYVDWKADGLYYSDPAQLFDLCKRRYSRFVVLLHDYPLYEWTIVVRR